MLLSFRQGLVQVQTNTPFLSRVGNNVRLVCDNTPFIGTFAHGNYNYLLVEPETIATAWHGPFLNTSNYYLYIDIDITSGIRTFGHTTVAPTHGSTAPTSPAVDHHFFNLRTNVMQVKTSTRWVDKIRLFVGYLQSGSILNTYAVGSTVALNQSNYSGQILFDDTGKPVKRLEKFANGAFLTTESFISYQNSLEQSAKAEGFAITAKAVETIPMNYCVCYKDYNKLGLASSTDTTNPCVGISLATYVNNEVVRFIKFGKISNPNSWNWTQPPMSPVFVGKNGEITATVPSDYSMQRIGYIIDSTSVFIDITDQLLINK
jgi:hypothetical protein